MNIKNTTRLYNTVKFLKVKQIYYRLYYFSRNRIRRVFKRQKVYFKVSSSHLLSLQNSLTVQNVYSRNNHFTFLNLSKQFDEKIDWNYKLNGKLWTYNLTYFDCLTQENYPINEYLPLIESFIDDIENIKDGLEPFPISLRAINWVKFFSKYSIINEKMNNSLYAQYYLLLEHLEYHLLGNHLLENGFSLLFGAYYFQDELLYEKAEKIVRQELNEQILKDGGHFELSPMYHQIMLFRLLDCINLLQNNAWKEDELLKFLLSKAQIMLAWLENISYKNGDIPLFNDSTNGIAPTTEQLFNYAQRLNIEMKKVELKESGYRKISKKNYECIVDVGAIGASYIPGHAHADTFNFELRIKGKPFIVDRGLSTYETNNRRAVERSTASHNTVEINGQSQSEVWGGFRVGERANVIKLREDSNLIEATHDGYKKSNVLHTRKWTFEDNKIMIEDGLNTSIQSIARFYFDPSISKETILEKIKFKNKKFIINKYTYALGFNKYMEAYRLEIEFEKKLEVKIFI